MAKTARIKNFQIEQILKTAGVEIQVDDNGKQFGDVYVNKVGVKWCNGGDWRKSGVLFKYDELDLLSQFKTEALKAAKEAQKNQKK